MFTITDLPNLLGWVVGVVPSAIVMYWVWLSRGESWRWSVLLCGILLIMLAVHMADLYIQLVSYVESLPETKRGAGSVWASLKTSGALWLAAFPAAAGGVGVNLISSWLTAPRRKSGG